MKGKLAVICLLLFILCSISTVCAENTNDTQIMQQNIAIDNLEVANDEVLWIPLETFKRLSVQHLQVQQ